MNDLQESPDPYFRLGASIAEEAMAASVEELEAIATRATAMYCAGNTSVPSIAGNLIALRCIDKVRDRLVQHADKLYKPVAFVYSLGVLMGSETAKSVTYKQTTGKDYGDVLSYQFAMKAAAYVTRQAMRVVHLSVIAGSG